MKNKIGQKRNTSYRYSCNNWSCPCNDGSKGCYAEINIMDLCDFSDAGFNHHLNKCYDARLKGEEEYELACKDFFAYCDSAYELCPANYKGYCCEYNDGCFNPKKCDKRLELLNNERQIVVKEIQV